MWALSNLGNDIKSGNIWVYGQMFGIMSGFAFIILSFVSLLSHLIYAILGTIFGVGILAFEARLFRWLLGLCIGRLSSISATRIIETWPLGGQVVRWGRAIVYIMLSVFTWYMVGDGFLLMIICAVLISLTAICYLMGGIFNFKQGEMSTFKSSQDSEYNKNPNSWLPI